MVGIGMSDLGAEASANDVELQRTRSGPPRIDRQADVSDKNDPSDRAVYDWRGDPNQAGLRPEEPAIVGNAFAPLSYRELQQQINEVRACLRQAGFDRDARIAVGIANGADAAWAIVTVACSAAAVPLDPKLTVAEVEKCLLVLRPNAAIVLRDSGAAIRPAAEKLGIPIVEALPCNLESSACGFRCPVSVPRVHWMILIRMLLHSFCTPQARQAIQIGSFSHRNVLASAKTVPSWFGLTPQDRCLNVSPVYYSHALTTTVLPPLLTGGSVALPANPLNVELSEWLGTLRPTWYSAGPTLHLAVLEKARLRPDARTMHSLRLASSAGARLPKDVQESLQSVLGVPVLEHYGSSGPRRFPPTCRRRGPASRGRAAFRGPVSWRSSAKMDGRWLRANRAKSW